MAGLDEVYRLAEDGKIEIIDHFEENEDLLVAKYVHQESSAIIEFRITSDFPDGDLELKVKTNEYDESYITEMLKITAKNNQCESMQLQNIIQEFELNLLPELELEKLQIEEGKKLRAEKIRQEVEVQEKNVKAEKPERKPKKQSKPNVKYQKSKMKTVIDVVNRIMWDDQLDQTDFTVGYLDRFIGIVEKRFDEFTWKNIVDVDYDQDFGVPEHRVQYFKYKDQKVWDRETREDFIFGSANGKGLTIDQFIAKSQ